MTDCDDFETEENGPSYRKPESITPTELTAALDTLLLTDAPFMATQAHNFAIVDQFIMKLEYDVRQEWLDTDRTPLNTFFLSAQSQMWIFSAYEWLRTWRQLAKNALKWHKNGGLETKIAALELETGYVHPGRMGRASQLRQLLEKPELITKIEEDIAITHIPFSRLEFIRVSIAKHEVRGKPNSIAYMPGYGRINMDCGSLDYQLNTEAAILGYISRRDIADELRKIADRSDIPSAEALKEFDEAMNPPSSFTDAIL